MEWDVNYHVSENRLGKLDVPSLKSFYNIPYASHLHAAKRCIKAKGVGS